MVYLGTILLWFGWFGFNGGSALASTPRAASSALVTTIAASFGAVTWIIQDYLMGPSKVTGVGFCSGVLAGLATITPGSGFVSTWAGCVIGILGAVICNFAVRAKGMLGYDDALDAFGLHGIGGFVGLIFAGIFRQRFISELDGDFISGGGAIDGDDGTLVGYQIAIAFAIAAYSFVVTYIILMVMKLIPGIEFMSNESAEKHGMDLEEMGEVAYAYAVVGRESIISFEMKKTASHGAVAGPSKQPHEIKEVEVANEIKL
jgi:Amt family ammonium transporter